jgi:peptidyl-tRNA hydrolase
MKPEAYVLSDFSVTEAGALAEILDMAVDALKFWIANDCRAAMNRFNMTHKKDDQ